MTDIDNPVTRRTQHVIGGRKVIATLTPGGITLRLERTTKTLKIDYAQLWLQLSNEERRGGNSEITIAPRSRRRAA